MRTHSDRAAYGPTIWAELYTMYAKATKACGSFPAICFSPSGFTTNESPPRDEEFPNCVFCSVSALTSIKRDDLSPLPPIVQKNLKPKCRQVAVQRREELCRHSGHFIHFRGKTDVMNEDLNIHQHDKCFKQQNPSLGNIYLRTLLTFCYN